MGLGLIMYARGAQRWINRPFVLFPEELTEEERSYYRRFQFQALDEAHANDLLDMQNIECARGFSAAFLLSETRKKRPFRFAKSIALLEQLIERKPRLRGSWAAHPPLRVYTCLMKTARTLPLFQDLVTTSTLSAAAAGLPLAYPQ
jgi:hypothetical protein